MARVLVAYASKRGSTAEIASWIADALRTEGHQVDLASVTSVTDARGYDAIILGGALYNRRWPLKGRFFTRRHRATLQATTVWLFSSGPLDPVTEDIAATPAVARIAERVGAAGHITFGGRLAPDATGFPASAMAKRMAGDHRDPERVRAWAKTIASQLG
ncbi:flavodoxin [Streptosporangiaceae bacterium NEAU-GS5]|nr:flavodoxin [Streptosporangiaceae bacterium NEAU-GS5]